MAPGQFRGCVDQVRGCDRGAGWGGPPAICHLSSSHVVLLRHSCSLAAVTLGRRVMYLMHAFSRTELQMHRRC